MTSVCDFKISLQYQINIYICTPPQQFLADSRHLQVENVSTHDFHQFLSTKTSYATNAILSALWTSFLTMASRRWRISLDTYIHNLWARRHGTAAPSNGGLHLFYCLTFLTLPLVTVLYSACAVTLSCFWTLYNHSCLLTYLPRHSQKDSSHHFGC